MDGMGRTGRRAAWALLLTVAGGLAAPATAQDTGEARLRRIEAELRAVQRKVFPDGAGRTLGPEIVSPTTPAAAPSGASASAIADILARLDTMEAQVRRLTAQLEEEQNRVGKLEARLASAEPAATPTSAASEAPAANGSTIAANTAAMTTPKVAPAAAKPSTDRAAALATVEKPKSADPGEDAYLYGYNLWAAKFYPEAETQLQTVVERYPRHKRISYARNLLGRAYLDDGKPSTAAQWFVQNYTTDKAGERAPDSLLYLAAAMVRLKETKRACVALQELHDTYPAVEGGRLKGEVARIRGSVTCN